MQTMCMAYMYIHVITWPNGYGGIIFVNSVGG